MSNPLWSWSARQVAAAIRTKEIKPSEAVDSVLNRLADVDPQIHAIAQVVEQAMEEAEAADRALATPGSSVGELFGVPITVKDLLATRGIATARGMAGMSGWVPDGDAPSVDLVRRSGAIIVAKTTTCELGYKAVTDSPLIPPTANPWDTSKTAGGSSGGASAALAAGIAPLAIATDGGGSIRIPGSFCGLPGLKPSTGIVPTYPPSRLGPLGHTGPMARSVADVALLLDAMTYGTRPCGAAAPALGGDDLRGVRIAYARSINASPVDGEVASVVERTVAVLEMAGATVEPIELSCPGFEDVWDTLYLAGVLADFRSLPRDVADTASEGLKGCVDLAARLPNNAAQRAEADRVVLSRGLRTRIDPYHLVVMPSVSLPAFDLGVDFPAKIGTESCGPFDWWRLTQVWNLVGAAALNLPIGFTAAGLPVGIQLVGRYGWDDFVLAAGEVAERLVGLPGEPIDPRGAP